MWSYLEGLDYKDQYSLILFHGLLYSSQCSNCFSCILFLKQLSEEGTIITLIFRCDWDRGQLRSLNWVTQTMNGKLDFQYTQWSITLVSWMLECATLFCQQLPIAEWHAFSTGCLHPMDVQTEDTKAQHLAPQLNKVHHWHFQSSPQNPPRPLLPPHQSSISPAAQFYFSHVPTDVFLRAGPKEWCVHTHLLFSLFPRKPTCESSNGWQPFPFTTQMGRLFANFTTIELKTLACPFLSRHVQMA